MKHDLSAQRKAVAILMFLVVGALPGVPKALQTPSIDDTLGKWVSAERFEGEPRISVAFRRGNGSIEGWAVLLGQHRKGDDRATLGLSFSGATWNGRSMEFSTILPEDEGTIGWELRVSTPTTATLSALTEDGLPINDDDLRWDMTR
jgi:hypothetical protein